MTILTSSFFWFVGLHTAAVLTLMWAQGKEMTSTLRLVVQKCVLVLWPVLLVGLIYSAWGDTGEQKKYEPPATQSPYFRCIYYRFPDGDVLPKATAGGGLPAAVSPVLLQDPAGCMDEFQDLIQHRPPHVVIFTGRADRRELAGATAQKYLSNEALAYQRAKSVKDQKAQAWKGQSILMAAGPVYFNGTIDGLLLERDRSVEIRAYWEPPPPAEGASPLANLFNVDHELALLAVIVALSTYLATIGVFIRQRINELGTSDPKASTIAKKNLRLLVLADLPLILSGLLLFFHVYFSWNSLRASMQLLSVAAVTLIVYHAWQWGRAGHSWWKI